MQDRTEIEAQPCDKIQFDWTKVNISEQDLEGSFCVDFSTSEAKIGGSIEKGETGSVEIVFDPCVVAVPGDCEVMLDGVLTSTVSDTQALSEYFQDFSFTLGFLEDIPDLKKFDQPI